MDLHQILTSEDKSKKLALFSFSSKNTEEEVLAKLNLWARYHFPQYFEDEDAPFHEDINRNNLKAYRGELDAFVDIAFRGAGKDVKTKLFITFALLNDEDTLKKYFKILSEDTTNSKQIVTDIYNMLVSPQIQELYPNTFAKTTFKREETMSSFTIAKGVKVIADTVGTEQRGAIQEASRPDFIWFNDFESRKTLRSITITKSIWDNMEEARTSLQKGGCCVYTCNYISELGNVHKLVTEKQSDRKKVLIVPIMKDGVPTWSRYTLQDINQMKIDDDDFEGERMCEPSASKDVYFDREMLDKMETRTPIKEIGGFKIYREYNPSHRYAGGHDVAGGVGLDSSASVFIDFSTIPAQVVGTFYSNTIEPEDFGDEIVAESRVFGDCIVAPENNKYDQTILKAKQLGANLYKLTKGKTAKTIHIANPKYEYGWQTNSLTKSKMAADFRKAVNDGLLVLNDPDLKQEAKSYTRNDLIDRQPDPRDVTTATRHFDLLTAAMIAWQMKDVAEANEAYDPYIEVPVGETMDKTNPAE